MRELVESASAIRDRIPQAWRRSDAFDHADLAARAEVDANGGMARTVRENRRKAGQYQDDEDVHSVILWLISTVLGEPPCVDDDEAAHRLLYGFDAHGLVEPVTPDGPSVVPEGPGAFVNALSLHVQMGVFTVAEDVSESELAAAKDLAITFGQVVRAVPPSDVLHHLGGAGVLAAWSPSDPMCVAQMLNYLVKLLRCQPVDISPIVEAVQQKGWSAASPQEADQRG